jgi:hypothetical protein
MESHVSARLVSPVPRVWVSAGAGVREDGILSEKDPVIVGFHSSTMTTRGSENALWDYATLNETLLGNQSVVCCREDLASQENPVFLRWKKRFALLTYRTKRELAQKLSAIDVTVLYQIKPGPYDHFLVPGVRNCVHAMFLSDEFHGDRFAYVSAWASRVMTKGESSFVPHFVPRLEARESLRKTLGIPPGAKVFGRHGAWDTFNIPFAREVVRRHARENSQDHFVFLNTEPVRGTQELGNVHYLPGTADPERKAAFLATCDAMLHARLHGETFGLAVGEFAVLRKPVITYSESRERAHLEMLGDQACLYRSAGELAAILMEFRPHQTKETQYEIFADPKVVMEFFQKKFLND